MTIASMVSKLQTSVFFIICITKFKFILLTRMHYYLNMRCSFISVMRTKLMSLLDCYSVLQFIIRSYKLAELIL